MHLSGGNRTQPGDVTARWAPGPAGQGSGQRWAQAGLRAASQCRRQREPSGASGLEGVDKREQTDPAAHSLPEGLVRCGPGLGWQPLRAGSGAEGPLPERRCDRTRRWRELGPRQPGSPGSPCSRLWVTHRGPCGPGTGGGPSGGALGPGAPPGPRRENLHGRFRVELSTSVPARSVPLQEGRRAPDGAPVSRTRGQGGPGVGTESTNAAPSWESRGILQMVGPQ